MFPLGLLLAWVIWGLFGYGWYPWRNRHSGPHRTPGVSTLAQLLFLPREVREADEKSGCLGGALPPPHRHIFRVLEPPFETPQQCGEGGSQELSTCGSTYTQQKLSQIVLWTVWVSSDKSRE